MESRGKHQRAGTPAGLRRLITAVVVMFLASFVAMPGVLAQDATEAPETPDVMIPGTGDEEPGSPDATAEATEAAPAETDEPASATPEPDDTTPSSTGARTQATEPGYPAVIAQGLALLSGEQSVWQVREVQPDSANEAEPEVSNAAFVYQVAGSSIIRNDVTGKRALLEEGEAFFKAGGDAYTTVADSNDATVWVFEVVGPNDVAQDAFYESPLIDDYDEGVFDMQLTRYVLEPGQAAEMPEHTGPALVLSTNGDIDIESGGLGLLATGDGQLVTEAATVTNNSTEPVDFVLAWFGAEVSDETSSPGTRAPSTDATDPTDDGTADAPAAEDGATDESAEAPQQPADDGSSDAGGFQTSINITAEQELYVVVVADGVTVFDGPIPSGQQSGVIVGSTFEVFTSNGAATLFTNSCGEDFYMGFEQGEARYYLEATSSSCPP